MMATFETVKVDTSSNPLSSSRQAGPGDNFDDSGEFDGYVST